MALKPEETQTSSTLRLLAWRNVLFLVFLAGFMSYQVCWYILSGTALPLTSDRGWTWGCLLLIGNKRLSSLPQRLLTMLKVYVPSLLVLVSCLPFAPTSTQGPSVEKYSRDFSRLIICLVTRGTNAEVSCI